MMTAMVKDWLWRQIWRNATMPEKYSHIYMYDGYEVDKLDLQVIFTYQVENLSSTLYHFMAHMVIM